MQFVPSKEYESISTFKIGILIYNGRILPDERVSIVGKFTSAILDLSSTMFCVPIINRRSSVAYSIVQDIHWNSKDCNHSGIETKLRYIEARHLIKTVKKSCLRCRYLNKKKIEAIVGPLTSTSRKVAPIFFSTQLDLSGPYKSFSPSHKLLLSKFGSLCIVAV